MAWIEIDLSNLIAEPKVSAAELLRRILDAYNINYQLLANCNPDACTEYYINDDEFIKALSEARNWFEEEVVVEEYARRRRARAAVLLYNGYEWAYALILRGERRT